MSASSGSPNKPTYRAALVGCSRMGAFIDNEVRSSRSIVRPYSHAAGYEACDRTDLIAGADLRPEVLEAFGGRYDVGPDHRYTDHRQMIERERPDILSIATQPEQRVEVALFAVEHGVRALYCEKPLAASVEEAYRLVAAVEQHGVALNMGTNRRWHPGFDALRDLIAAGDLGALRTLVIYSNGTLFNTSSHWFDVAMRLHGDVPVTWAQAHLPRGDQQMRGDEVIAEPEAQGIFAFANGVMAHAMLSPRNNDIEAIGERGYVTARNGGARFDLYRLETVDGERTHVAAPFPSFTPASSTLRLIEDLVQALDTGQPTRGGARVAAANMELIFAFIESHRRGGQRVPLPLQESPLRFVRRDFQARQPKTA
jgi:UDP-N-acetylglucosamine 3-dehydrogenase